jgi:hypothetical protein
MDNKQDSSVKAKVRDEAINALSLLEDSDQIKVVAYIKSLVELSKATNESEQ